MQGLQQAEPLPAYANALFSRDNDIKIFVDPSKSGLTAVEKIAICLYALKHEDAGFRAWLNQIPYDRDREALIAVCIRILTRKKANLTDVNYKTPVELALEMGATELVKGLVDLGEPISISKDKDDECHLKPLLGCSSASVFDKNDDEKEKEQYDIATSRIAMTLPSSQTFALVVQRTAIIKTINDAFTIEKLTGSRVLKPIEYYDDNIDHDDRSARELQLHNYHTKLFDLQGRYEAKLLALKTRIANTKSLTQQSIRSQNKTFVKLSRRLLSQYHSERDLLMAKQTYTYNFQWELKYVVRSCKKMMLPVAMLFLTSAFV